MFTLFAFIVLDKNIKVVPIYGHNIFSFFWQPSDCFNLVQTQTSGAVEAGKVCSPIIYNVMQMQVSRTEVVLPCVTVLSPLPCSQPQERISHHSVGFSNQEHKKCPPGSSQRFMLSPDSAPDNGSATCCGGRIISPRHRF